jgi:type IV pilus assembly protein PilE
MTHINYNRLAGLTLIELMVVIAIIGILSGIAYPSYQGYVHSTNRTAATACMMELAHVMEREYSTTFSYADVNLPNLQCRSDLSERYVFSSANQAARTYQIVATPTERQNDGCGVLLLDQSGRKGAKNGFNADDVKNCW